MAENTQVIVIVAIALHILVFLAIGLIQLLFELGPVRPNHLNQNGLLVDWTYRVLRCLYHLFISVGLPIIFYVLLSPFLIMAILCRGLCILALILFILLARLLMTLLIHQAGPAGPAWRNLAILIRTLFVFWVAFDPYLGGLHFKIKRKVVYWRVYHRWLVTDPDLAFLKQRIEELFWRWW
jgi:hypothetical protein